MRRRSTHYIVAIVFTSACGGGTPSSPSSPTPTTWILAGTVRDAQDNTALANTTVVILDGPNANRTATTNSSGSYALQNLQAGGFTVQFTRAITTPRVSE